MTGTPWLGDREQHAWRAYLRMERDLASVLARRLQAETGLSMADYEVLVNLSEAPRGRLRAFELARAMRWEKSRLSHHLRRMTARSLVGREGCDSDARGAYVTLTRKGRAAIQRAAPVHVADVRRYVLDALAPGQLDALADAAETVVAALAADGQTGDQTPDGGAPGRSCEDA